LVYKVYSLPTRKTGRTISRGHDRLKMLKRQTTNVWSGWRRVASRPSYSRARSRQDADRPAPPHRSVRAELPHGSFLGCWRGLPLLGVSHRVRHLDTLESGPASGTYAHTRDSPWPPPFPPSPPRRCSPLGPRALLGDFIGTTTRSDSSKTYTRAALLLPSPAGLSRDAPGISEVSRFS
jgi:hypothetical protein